MYKERFACYKVDIPEFDDHHWEMFCKMGVAMSHCQSRDKDRAVAALADLITYSLSHFKDEETFMEQIEYPWLDTHCTYHEKLKEDLQAFLSGISVGKCLASDLALKFEDTFIKHIDEQDMQYAQWYKRNKRPE